MKAYELHNWIAEMAPTPWPQDQVDGIMAGDPQAEVTGVAVTWLPNLDVLHRAAQQGLNFVIAHEPVFYHHPYYYPFGDNTHVPADDLESKKATPPALAKQFVIQQHNLVVYRLHDGWDQFPAYGMGFALADSLGWSDRQVSSDYIYEVGPLTLLDLAAMVARKLDKPGIRFVGDPDRVVRKVTLDWGSPGAIDIMLRALNHGCDASITGEVVEWRDVEFARDAGVGLITGGHYATETPGMLSFHRWFGPQWPNLPVEYIVAGDPDCFFAVA